MHSWRLKKITHTCSQCQHQFSADDATLLKTGWGRMWFTHFLGISYRQQLEDYQKLQCPQCGSIETNANILFFGICHPKWIWFFVWGLLMLLFVLGILGV